MFSVTVYLFQISETKLAKMSIATVKKTDTEIDRLFRRAKIDFNHPYSKAEADLASLLSVSTRTIANYRSGDSAPDAEQLQVINSYFHGIINSEQV